MSPATPTYVAVVDDDESVRRGLCLLLRAGGIQPVAYSSAEAFLADDRAPKFNCLVLDIHLGGISGIELQRRCVSAGDKTPIIFLTACEDLQSRAAAEAAGCSAYFLKTAADSDLLEVIRQLAA